MHRLLIVSLFAFACASHAPLAGTRQERVPEGDWGGDQVFLRIDAEGGSVEFACAHGALEAPLVLDDEGRFDVPGSFEVEGGPARSDSRPERARYQGRLDGEELTFRVRLVDEERVIGPFTATLGRQVRLFKCL
jgi:hypothetical protein